MVEVFIRAASAPHSNLTSRSSSRRGPSVSVTSRMSWRYLRKKLRAVDHDARFSATRNTAKPGGPTEFLLDEFFLFWMEEKHPLCPFGVGRKGRNVLPSNELLAVDWSHHGRSRRLRTVNHVGSARGQLEPVEFRPFAIMRMNSKSIATRCVLQCHRVSRCAQELRWDPAPTCCPRGFADNRESVLENFVQRTTPPR